MDEKVQKVADGRYVVICAVFLKFLPITWAPSGNLIVYSRDRPKTWNISQPIPSAGLSIAPL